MAWLLAAVALKPRFDRAEFVKLRQREIERVTSSAPPIATTEPFSSDSSMNSFGCSSPRYGCCQRTSASRPTTLPEKRSTIGW